MFSSSADASVLSPDVASAFDAVVESLDVSSFLSPHPASNDMHIAPASAIAAYFLNFITVPPLNKSCFFVF